MSAPLAAFMGLLVAIGLMVIVVGGGILLLHLLLGLAK